MPKVKEIVHIKQWNGGYETRAILDNGETTIVSDNAKLNAAIVEMINTKGFNLARAPRQEYQRLTIN